MEDEEIVALYWERDEAAIRETQRKYGKRLRRIVHGILSDPEDRKESLNDTYMRAWNSMPPHKPPVLPAYLATLARRAAIDLYRKNTRDKRKASEYTVSLSELGQCVTAGDVTVQSVDMALLAEAIDEYLHTLPAKTRILFMRRYYFADSMRQAAAFCGMSESKAASLLYRVRIGLKNYLIEKGFTV